jgi:hypothetical protein
LKKFFPGGLALQELEKANYILSFFKPDILLLFRTFPELIKPVFYMAFFADSSQVGSQAISYAKVESIWLGRIYSKVEMVLSNPLPSFGVYRQELFESFVVLLTPAGNIMAKDGQL